MESHVFDKDIWGKFILRKMNEYAEQKPYTDRKEEGDGEHQRNCGVKITTPPNAPVKGSLG